GPPADRGDAADPAALRRRRTHRHRLQPPARGGRDDLQPRRRHAHGAGARGRLGHRHGRGQRPHPRGGLPVHHRRVRVGPGRPRHPERAAEAGAAPMSTPSTSTPPPAPPTAARDRAPLRVPVEWRRQMGRARTRWAFGILLVLPLIVVAAFFLGDEPTGSGTRFSDLATLGAANFAVFMLFVSAELLLLILA